MVDIGGVGRAPATGGNGPYILDPKARAKQELFESMLLVTKALTQGFSDKRVLADLGKQIEASLKKILNDKEIPQEIREHVKHYAKELPKILGEEHTDGYYHLDDAHLKKLEKLKNKGMDLARSL